MRVLVIGGTLFIGRLLVEELLKDGHEVAVLHRQPKHDWGRRVENIMADRNDADAMREALSTRRFDVVFDNVYDWERGTTAAQVEATVRACGDRLSRYIFMSSVAAYGDGLNHKESDPLAPDSHPAPYVSHKATTERLLFRMRRQTGLPLVTFPSAVRLWAGQSVLPRTVFLGPPARGPAHHHPRRRLSPHAVRLCERPGGGSDSRHDGTAGGG